MVFIRRKSGICSVELDTIINSKDSHYLYNLQKPIGYSLSYTLLGYYTIERSNRFESVRLVIRDQQVRMF